MKRTISLYFLILFILQAVPLRAESISQWLKDHNVKLASEKLPSVQVVVGKEGQTLESFSSKTQETKITITKESLFDLASMSKVITALGIQIALYGSEYTIDSKVGDILSNDLNLCDNPKILSILKKHTVKDFLQHQSYIHEIHWGGLIRTDSYLSVWESIYSYLGKHPYDLKSKSTQKRYKYKDVHYIILGRVIEVISGVSLVDFYNNKIFYPLKLNYEKTNSEKIVIPEIQKEKVAETQEKIEPAYKPIYAISKYHEDFVMRSDTLDISSRMVPSYQIKKNDELLSVDQLYKNLFHDPTVKVIGGVAGHAGVISSAVAFQQIIKVFLDSRIVTKGIIKPREGLHPLLKIPYKNIYQVYSRKNMSRSGRGLGVDIESSYAYSPSGKGIFGRTAFGHTGYTGTSFWVDTCTGLYYIFLGNRTHVSSNVPVSINYERRIVARKTIELYSTKEICKYE